MVSKVRVENILRSNKKGSEITEKSNRKNMADKIRD